MPIQVKICGINTAQAMTAAVGGGADYVGLVFYPPSPRAVTPGEARQLAQRVPEGVLKVGMLVDLGDAEIAAILAEAPLDLLQLHGSEAPARVAAIRARFGLPVMKAVRIAGAADVAVAAGYCGTADRLLFDASRPRT